MLLGPPSVRCWRSAPRLYSLSDPSHASDIERGAAKLSVDRAPFFEVILIFAFLDLTGAILDGLFQYDAGPRRHARAIIHELGGNGRRRLSAALNADGDAPEPYVRYDRNARNGRHGWSRRNEFNARYARHDGAQCDLVGGPVPPASREEPNQALRRWACLQHYRVRADELFPGVRQS